MAIHSVYMLAHSREQNSDRLLSNSFPQFLHFIDTTNPFFAHTAGGIG